MEATSVLSTDPGPVVNQSFLDDDFTFRELQTAFLRSITPEEPRNVRAERFRRACEAASQLTVCLMNGWGHPSWHDMPAVMSMLARQLASAARHGSWFSAVFCSYLDPQGSMAISERQNAPTRLWESWATLKGCQTAARKLHVADPRLYHKVLTIACLRCGPLHDKDDPTAFVENKVRQQVQAGHSNLDEMVTERGNSFLDLAIYNGNLPLIRELVEDRHCDINQRTIRITDTDVVMSEGGETPIMLAARTRNLDIFRYFLDRDADLSPTSDYGCNVLHAITWFSDDIAAALLPDLVSKGASLSAVARTYYPRGVYNPFTHVEINGSPLRWAVTIGHMSLTQRLVESHIGRAEAVPDLEDVLAQAASNFNANSLALLVDHFPQLHLSRAPVSPGTLDMLLGCSLSNPMQFHQINLHGMLSAEAQVNTVEFLLHKGASPLRQA